MLSVRTHQLSTAVGRDRFVSLLILGPIFDLTLIGSAMTEPQSCYMCDSPSTSREHVPPLCVFPESKDVAGDYRKDLITVPSCDVHNSHKSADDEFLMVSLAGLIGNNSIGFMHKLTKVNRAIYRSSRVLLDQAMLNQSWHVVEVAPNKFLDVIWGTPDYGRLVICFDRIARGLYFRHFANRFRGTTKAILGYVHHQSGNSAEFVRLIRNKAEVELGGKARHGANPDVFFFRCADPDDFGIHLIHLCFYGGLDIFVALIPEKTELPFNLGMQFIQGGMRTTINEAGQQYEFNVDAPDVNPTE